MPIYAYRCGVCGYRKDVLQKLSDPALSTCPACGAEAFAKQVTAAGFQLKGSGWYVTDFKDGSSGKGTNGAAARSEDKPAESAPSEAKPDAAASSDASSGSSGSNASH